MLNCSSDHTWLNLLNIETRDIGLMEQSVKLLRYLKILHLLPHIEQFIMVIEENARLNLDQVRTWENTLISNNDCISQDSTILFDSLMHTLSVNWTGHGEYRGDL